MSDNTPTTTTPTATATTATTPKCRKPRSRRDRAILAVQEMQPLSDADNAIYDAIAAVIVAQRQQEVGRLSANERAKRERQEAERRVIPVPVEVRARADRYIRRLATGTTVAAALVDAGTTWSEICLIRLADPDFEAVDNWVRDHRRELFAARAEDRLGQMLAGDLDERDGNIHAVMFALERLRRASYARDYHSGAERIDAAAAARGGGAAVVYNINITAAAADGGANRATIGQQSPPIDV